MAEPSEESLDLARRSKDLTDRLRELQAEQEVDYFLRRHQWRLANDGGVTYKQLAQMCSTTTSIVGEHIARARAEAAVGTVPAGL